MSAAKNSSRKRFKKSRRRRAKRRVLTLILSLITVSVVVAVMFAVLDERSSRQSLNKALAYRQHGEFAASIIEFKSALQNDPENAALRISLGQTYLQLNDLTSAEKEFRRAQSAGAGPGEIFRLLARTWLLQGKYQQVLDEISLEGLEGETQADALVARGRAHVGLKRAEEAREAFDQALQISPRHVGAWMEITRTDIDNNRIVEASQALRMLQDLAPENLEVTALQGDLYLNTGRYADAVATYQKVIVRLPGHILTKVAMAQALFEQGLDDESVKLLDDALQQDPSNFTANHLRATIAIRGKNYLVALERAERALETNATDLRTLIIAGSAAFELGRLELAQLKLDKAISRDPDNAIANQLLSTIREQRALRDWDQTLAQLIDDSSAASIVAAAVDPTILERQILDSGLAYLDTRRQSAGSAAGEEGDKKLSDAMEIFKTASADQAINLLEFVLTENSSSQQVRNLLAEAYLRRGKPEEAYQLIETELDRQRGSRQIMALAAMAGLVTNRADQARLALRSLDDLDPRAVEIHYLLAVAYNKLGNKKAYSDSLERALAIDPDYGLAIAERVRSALSDQRLDEADKGVQKLKALWPDRPEYHDLLAGVALLRGQAIDAARSYRKAFHVQPTTVRALRLAHAEHRSGRIHESQTVLTNWLSEHPNDTSVALALANKYLSAGALVDASEIYSIILRQRPNHIVAMNNLAWVSLQLGEREVALELAKRGLELSPDNMHLMDTLAEIHLSDGEHEEALPLLKRVVRSEHAGPGVQVKLARTLAQTGNRAEARDLLRQTLTAYREFPERRDAERLSAELEE